MFEIPGQPTYTRSSALAPPLSAQTRSPPLRAGILAMFLLLLTPSIAWAQADLDDLEEFEEVEEELMEDGDVRELRSEIRIRDGEEPLIQIWKNGELMELDAHGYRHFGGGS